MDNLQYYPVTGPACYRPYRPGLLPACYRPYRPGLLPTRPVTGHTGPACYRPYRPGHTGHTDIKYADESLKIATKQICENLSVLILKSKKMEMKLRCPKCNKDGTADVFKKAGLPIAILFECGHSLEGIQAITQYVESSQKPQK